MISNPVKIEVMGIHEKNEADRFIQIIAWTPDAPDDNGVTLAIEDTEGLSVEQMTKKMEEWRVKMLVAFPEAEFELNLHQGE